MESTRRLLWAGGDMSKKLDSWWSTRRLHWGWVAGTFQASPMKFTVVALLGGQRRPRLETRKHWHMWLRGHVAIWYVMHLFQPRPGVLTPRCRSKDLCSPTLPRPGMLMPDCWSEGPLQRKLSEHMLRFTSYIKSGRGQACLCLIARRAGLFSESPVRTCSGSRATPILARARHAYG